MESNSSCKKGKINALLSGGGAVTLSLIVIGLGLVASFSSKGSLPSRLSSLKPSSVTIAMGTSDVRTIDVGQSWQIVRINPQSNCRLDPESGDTVLVRFGNLDRIFEKANGRWFSNGQQLDRLPEEIAVNQFEVRSRSNIQVKISTWPK